MLSEAEGSLKIMYTQPLKQNEPNEYPVLASLCVIFAQLFIHYKMQWIPQEEMTLVVRCSYASNNDTTA